jgi:transposase-like protein
VNNETQIKTGKNRSGTQRILCRGCGITYTIEAKPRGYTEEVREKAVRMDVEGNNFRRIGRHLRVNHQSVVNWVNAYHEKIKNAMVVRVILKQLKWTSRGVSSARKKQSLHRNGS